MARLVTLFLCKFDNNIKTLITDYTNYELQQRHKKNIQPNIQKILLCLPGIQATKCSRHGTVKISNKLKNEAGLAQAGDLNHIMIWLLHTNMIIK